MALRYVLSHAGMYLMISLMVFPADSGNGATKAAGRHTISGVGISLAQQLASDMQGKNEGRPHGVPASYLWAQGPVTVMGNNANGWHAITAWGVVQEAAEGNRARNARVNIRNMQCLLLRKADHNWVVLQHTNVPDGAAYVEDYSGNANRPADIRSEPDGSISVTAGAGYNFHFYARERASIDPNDIEGLVTSFEARLIVGDPNKPDDRPLARYLASSGADYYPALSGPWPGTLTFNPGVACGKLKYVSGNWRRFAMTTLTVDQLTQNI